MGRQDSGSLGTYVAVINSYISVTAAVIGDESAIIGRVVAALAMHTIDKALALCYPSS